MTDRPLVPLTLTRDPADDVRRVASSPLPLNLGPRDLVEAFLAGRAPNTLDAYRRDLTDFTGFLRVESLDDAAAQLLARSHGEANALALGYRAGLIDRRLAPATINRRLAALRSLVALARTLGLVSWTLEVESLRSTPYRDVCGPGVEGVAAMLEAIEGRGGTCAARDRVIVRMLFDLALRRGELAGLDLADVDVERALVRVVGKGQREAALLTLPAPTLATLREWLDVRGAQGVKEELTLGVWPEPAEHPRRVSSNSVAPEHDSSQVRSGHAVGGERRQLTVHGTARASFLRQAGTRTGRGGPCGACRPITARGASRQAPAPLLHVTPN